MLKMTTLIFPAQIASDRLMGSNSLPPRLTGALYHDFLRNFLSGLLRGVDLQTSIHLWFMHDDASPHVLLAAWEFLNNVFPEQWIGRGGPTARPARSLIEVP
jgi:hypothetical protein